MISKSISWSTWLVANPSANIPLQPQTKGGTYNSHPSSIPVTNLRSLPPRVIGVVGVTGGERVVLVVVAILEDLGKDGGGDVGKRNGLALLVTKVYWFEGKEFVSVNSLTEQVWCENSCETKGDSQTADLIKKL